MTTDPNIPLPIAAARALLERVIEAATRPGAVVCFDLDSTLLDNSPRQALIMREYGVDARIAALSEVQPEHWDGWSYEIPMRAAGLSTAEIEEHGPRFKDWWQERFFTSEYCIHDQPITGAPEFVAAVAATGSAICYVTGRHEPMRDGSIRSFCDAGFPVPDGERVKLLMKPELTESDDAYKLRAYEILRSMGEVIAAFDNEPAHINGYQDAFPEAHSIHLATDHSMRKIGVAEGIPSIADFASWLGR
jgi:predicted secreted acid phosphatase